MTSPSSAAVRRAIAIIFIISLPVFEAWLALAHPGITLRILAQGAALSLYALAGAVLCLWVAAHPAPLRQRLAWAAFGAGLLMLSAEGAGFFLQERGVAVDVNFTIPLRAVSVLLFIAGLLLYPLQRRRLAAALLALDISVVVGATLVIIWTLAFRAYLLNPPGNLALVVLPVLGVILVNALTTLFLYNESPSAPPGLALAAAALALFAVASLYDVFLARQNILLPDTLDNLVWMTGSLLLALAALTDPQVSWKSARLPSPAVQALDWLQRSLPKVLCLLMGIQIIVSWLVFREFFASGPFILIILTIMLYGRRVIAAEEVELRPFAGLVNSVAEPAFVCDETGMLRLVNPALLSAAGYLLPKELLGRPLQDILETPGSLETMLDQALSRHSDDPERTRPLGWGGEVALRRRGGTSIPVYLSLRPIYSEGGLHEHLAVAGTAHDLTRHKRQQADLQAAYEQVARAHEALEKLNQELELKVASETQELNLANKRLEDQNRKLQKLDRLKSDFVSMVSHELRAPLTNINGGIELVLSRPIPLDPGVRSNLELVQDEIKRLTRFVETILDLSAIEAGRFPLYLAPVPYEEVVAALQAQLVHRPGVERIRWEGPPGLPELYADEQALISVLFHLVDNAMKYAPQGEITVSASEEDHRVIVRVQDRGPGFPTDSIEMLFDRFHRLNPEDSQTVYGHGLGLYIVRRLLEAMGGEIEAANREGGGAVFTCRLCTTAEWKAEGTHATKNSSGR